MTKKVPLSRRIKELEIELEDTKSLSAAREALLMKNIEELNEIYQVLRGKVREIKERDERILRSDAELMRANRLSALGELAASIAHEIKNPLIAIQGFAKRIEHVGASEQIERYAKLIDQESERLSTVLARLLEFSRMSEPSREYLDVNDLVDDTVLFLEHHLTRFRKIELSVEKENGLPQVSVDKVHIQQALMNLVMNAAQAMPEGGPLLIRTLKRDDGYVSIAVTDNGTGIKEENLQKIFEPFFTTKAKGEGTGLGLSLCKRLVEANEGKIEVQTRLDEGSTFSILLPFEALTPVAGT